MKNFISFALPAEPFFLKSFMPGQKQGSFDKRNLYIRIKPGKIAGPDFVEKAWGLEKCLEDLSLMGNTRCADFVRSMSSAGHKMADAALQNLASLERIPDTGLMSRGEFNSRDIIISICVSGKTLFFTAMATDVCEHCSTMKSHYMDSRSFTLYSGLSYIKPQIKNFTPVEPGLAGNVNDYYFDLKAQAISHKILYSSRSDYDLEDITAGMCGVLFIDFLRERMILARDLFGQIPLYYSLFNFSHDRPAMAVGSNQLLLKKTLIAGNVLSDSKDKERCGREERADSFFWKDHIDPKGVDHFLAYNYLPGRKTFFKGINALRGGEAFEFKANDNISYMFAHKGLFPYFEVENKLACTYFYILPCFTEPDHSPFDSASESSSESSSKPSPARLSKSFPNLSSESVSEALAESLAKAADRILKACVCSGCALKEEKNPVQNSDIRAGMLLSGGVDSSFVALSIKNGYQNKKIPCRMESALSIDFSYENYSEKEKFQPVAQKLNLSLIKKTLAPNVLSYLPLIHSKLGWPAADASFMGLYVSGRSASDMGYHALYTGDGGDEIFGGYLRHDIVRKDVDAENCKSFEECKSMDAYIRELSLFDLSERQELYSREFLKDLDNSPEDMNVIHESLEMGKTRTRDIRDLTCFLDLVTLLPGNNCPKTTVMLGMNKVIPVSPMLDKEWAFKAMSYPVHTRFSPDYSKAVLRDYLTKEFPENISMAPKRMLTLPVGEWYSHQLRRRLMKLSEKDLLIEKHYIKKGSFKRILGNHFKTKETRRLRALIAFESFLLFLDTGKGLTW